MSPAPGWEGATEASGDLVTAERATTQEFPHRLILEDEDGASIRVVVDYEVIYDPDKEATFAVPNTLYLAPDGRQFYFDARDNDFKVLSEDNEFLYSVGGKGSSPGEWASIPGVAGFSPDGLFYVFDRLAGRFIVYTLEGEFLYHIASPVRISNASGLLFLAPDEMLFGALSIAPDYYGYFIHRFRIVEKASRKELKRISSFAEVPKYDRGIYGTLAIAAIRFDRDGAILMNTVTSYSLRKYAVTGDLHWAVEDPDVFPAAADNLSDTSSGRVRIGPIARSVAFLPISADYYLHFVVFPADNLPEISGVVSPSDVDLSGVEIRKTIELIPTREQTGPKIQVHTTQDLVFTDIDDRGRIYGILRLFDPILIRGRISIAKESPE